MKLNKFELFGAAASVAILAVALWLVRVETSTLPVDETAVTQEQPAAVVVSRGENINQEQANYEAVVGALDEDGQLGRLVIDDVVVGGGETVDVGDTVTVNYIGRLQNGQEFDNSYNRGETFTFTVGEGRVIKGWEEGVVGMNVGGQRILVIPSDKAYGPKGFGPIPGGATLLFTIELLSIES